MGLAALLSVETGRFLLPSEEKETELLRRVVDAGGVDGCTRERTMTVDHLALDVHLSVLRAVTELTKEPWGKRFLNRSSLSPAPDMRDAVFLRRRFRRFYRMHCQNRSSD
ncbi:MAG: glutamate cyclase domain-containing protein [[Clostridium] symbiosum]